MCMQNKKDSRISLDGIRFQIPSEIKPPWSVQIFVEQERRDFAPWPTTTKIKDFMEKRTHQKAKIENIEHLIASKTTTAIKNLTCRAIWCKLDSSYFRSEKKPGLGSISHTILTIFFFSADWNSLFRKVRWSDIMNLKIVRAAQCVLLCFARFCKFCTATRRKAQLSCAWVKCGAERTMDVSCLFQTSLIYFEVMILELLLVSVQEIIPLRSQFACLYWGWDSYEVLKMYYDYSDMLYTKNILCFLLSSMRHWYFACFSGFKKFCCVQFCFLYNLLQNLFHNFGTTDLAKI